MAALISSQGLFAQSTLPFHRLTVGISCSLQPLTGKIYTYFRSKVSGQLPAISMLDSSLTVHLPYLSSPLRTRFFAVRHRQLIKDVDHRASGGRHGKLRTH